jgi:DNA uptake protein ComE-like DNA-binding protein
MNKEFFRKAGSWFGYSRRERRASVFLIIIILAVLAVRGLWPGRDGKPEIYYPDLPSLTGEAKEIFKRDNSGSRPYRAGNTSSRTSVVELNSCDSASLEALPGIGPVLARRITRYRGLLGGYFSTEQLKEVYGLSDSVFTIVNKWVKADPRLIKKTRINSASFNELNRLPYLGKSKVNAIVEFRSRFGRIESMGQLVENYIIPDTTAQKVKWYIDFR